MPFCPSPPISVLTAGLLSKGWEVQPGVQETEEGYKPAKARADWVKAAFDEMPGSLDDVIEEVVKDALRSAFRKLTGKVD